MDQELPIKQKLMMKSSYIDRTNMNYIPLLRTQMYIFLINWLGYSGDHMSINIVVLVKKW